MLTWNESYVYETAFFNHKLHQYTHISVEVIVMAGLPTRSCDYRRYVPTKKEIIVSNYWSFIPLKKKPLTFLVFTLEAYP